MFVVRANSPKYVSSVFHARAQPLVSPLHQCSNLTEVIHLERRATHALFTDSPAIANKSHGGHFLAVLLFLELFSLLTETLR